MVNISKLSENQIKKINLSELALKHKCSNAYVGQVLRGVKGKNKKAQAIREDALAIVKIFENPINDIEVIDPQIVTA
jgi:hypothetical protein